MPYPGQSYFDDNADGDDDEVGHPCPSLDNLQGVGHAGGNCSSGSTFIWFLKKCFSFCYFVYRARKPRHHRLLFGWVLCIFASATRTCGFFKKQKHFQYLSVYLCFNNSYLWFSRFSKQIIGIILREVPASETLQKQEYFFFMNQTRLDLPLFRCASISWFQVFSEWVSE